MELNLSTITLFFGTIVCYLGVVFCIFMAKNVLKSSFVVFLYFKLQTHSQLMRIIEKNIWKRWEEALDLFAQNCEITELNSDEFYISLTFKTFAWFSENIRKMRIDEKPTRD